MTELIRNPEECKKTPYDLIIAGGGIYGAMLSYEAVRRNLKPLMLEKNDFTNATSLNHLRTVHGGLRYLQTLDLHRFGESVRERKWFLQHFPHRVESMPCLMPLYGSGLRRTAILKIALMMNDLFSSGRNKGVSLNRHLPNGKVISARQTAEIFPGIDSKGLKGSAVWYDAAISEFQRLMMDLMRLTASHGARFLNYTEATGLLKENNAVTGVRAYDGETGKEYEFKAPRVINAAGPWSREVATKFDRDHVPLFKKRLLLWNVLFKREAMSNYALGLSPGKDKGRSYFFHPWKDRLLVGTGELVVEQSNRETIVPAAEMDKFIADINVMSPDLNLTIDDIQRVYTGILPAREDGTLAKREAIFHHKKEGGPNGLYSISGVKFTTSRLVAEKTLDTIFPGKNQRPHHEMMEVMDSDEVSFPYQWKPGNAGDLEVLKKIIAEEAVLHLSDLILRRTSLGDHPQRALDILKDIKGLFNWDESKWNNEVDALKTAFKWR